MSALAETFCGGRQNKSMENEKDQCKCPVCVQREEDQTVQEELNFAVLIALVPAMAITLFNNIGWL